jgi:SAM-dependent methyltransferase
VAALERPPSSWLAENAALLGDGGGRLALDVACGDGRNAAYLAGFGFEVDAVDVSDVAVEAVAAAAAARGIVVRTHRLDLERAPPPRTGYHAIVQINYLQRELFPTLAEALAPGGLLIVQTFMRPHEPGEEARLDPQFLLAPGELLQLVGDLRVLRHREGVVEHAGRPAAVAGIVAQR